MELFRGNLAAGVRGVIDPFDPDNPYGCGKSANKSNVDKIQSKVSFRTVSTVAESNMSGIMSTTDNEINLSGVELFSNPLYSFNSVGHMGSIFMSREREDEFFEVPPNKDKLLYDEANEEIKFLCKDVKLN